MPKLTVVIPEDLDKQFRHKVVEKYGGHKGALGKAIEEALRLWLKESK